MPYPENGSLDFRLYKIHIHHSITKYCNFCIDRPHLEGQSQNFSFSRLDLIFYSEWFKLVQTFSLHLSR